MNLIDTLKGKLNGEKLRIVLPESEDERILEAASIIIKEDIASIILLGDINNYVDKYEILRNATWINPQNCELLDSYVERLYELRKEKGMTIEEARRLLTTDYMYFACMLLLDKKADGIVSGACHSSSNTLRPALQIIKGKEKLVSSFFIMETDKENLGENGVFIFADCGLNQNPNSEELSVIAKHSIDSFIELVGSTPKVAFLSHSTYGSSNHEMVYKVKDAVALTKQFNSNYLIDGELQLDAAIIPEVAIKKCPESPLKGEANILIFPDLDSGNIGYKLVERFGNNKAYGPLTQGLKYPVNDLSRGSSVEDIVGVIVITCIQAKKSML